MVLGGVPDTAAFLSVKSAWNLRVRKGVSFDGGGLASVDFSGPTPFLPHELHPIPLFTAFPPKANS